MVGAEQCGVQEAGVAGAVETGPGPPLEPPRPAVVPVDSTKPGTDRTLRWKFPACRVRPQTAS